MMNKCEEIMGMGPSIFSDTVDMKRKAHPKEIAHVVEFYLSDGSSYITGTSPPVDGGLAG